MKKNNGHRPGLNTPVRDVNAPLTPAAKDFPPLSAVTRPALDTDAAAYYLNRRPQTLRKWAMGDGLGPIRPIRVFGRLAWPVSEIRRILEGGPR
jgi:hypothetical protein